MPVGGEQEGAVAVLDRDASAEPDRGARPRRWRRRGASIWTGVLRDEADAAGGGDEQVEVAVGVDVGDDHGVGGAAASIVVASLKPPAAPLLTSSSVPAPSTPTTRSAKPSPSMSAAASAVTAAVASAAAGGERERRVGAACCVKSVDGGAAEHDVELAVAVGVDEQRPTSRRSTPVSVGPAVKRARCRC